jgi:hypothetical protein
MPRRAVLKFSKIGVIHMLHRASRRDEGGPIELEGKNQFGLPSVSRGITDLLNIQIIRASLWDVAAVLGEGIRTDGTVCQFLSGGSHIMTLNNTYTASELKRFPKPTL